LNNELRINSVFL